VADGDITIIGTDLGITAIGAGLTHIIILHSGELAGVGATHTGMVDIMEDIIIHIMVIITAI
jgi:hypothetical protein